MAAARRSAGDGAGVDAASDDGEVENPVQKSLPRGVRLFTLAISLSLWIKSQPNPKATEKGKTQDFARRIWLKAGWLGELSYQEAARRLRGAFPGGTGNASISFALTRSRTHGPHLENPRFH